FAAETGTDEASRAGLARAQAEVGNIQRFLGRLPQAEQAYDRAAALYTRLAAESPGRLEYRRKLALLLERRTHLWEDTGRRPQAEAALGELIEIQRQLAAA